MSYWTHIRGSITVEPMGTTDEEREYILKTVLNHLPAVSGSERDMQTHVVKFSGHNMLSSCNEFGEVYYGRKRYFNGQSRFHVIVEGDLRDRMFSETHREFMKWLMRLCKRVSVLDVQVSLRDHERSYLFDFKPYSLTHLCEDVSRFSNDGSVNWCEYLTWKREYETWYPAVLLYKYVNDPKNDRAVEHWLGLTD